MISFGEYLKDYLEFNNISQTEFAMRMGITQKHMNEILNGKKNVTAEMAANIERLTGINSGFILKVENSKKITDKIIEKYKNEENLKKSINNEYYINELKKKNWINFKDETNIYQVCIDLLDFLKIKDFDVVENLEKQILFKKSGTDFKKLALWIARCDELASKQIINQYNKYNFNFLISDLKEEAFKQKIDNDKIREIFNAYGLFFVSEKAMSGTKVRGCFKVKGKNPAVYITENYAGKDSFYYELFHELGHCKSSYNEAKNKVIVDGTEEQEKKADEFALNTMISQKIWSDIKNKINNEEELLKVSKEYKIPTSFIVGRLAKNGNIKYNSRIYQKYSKI